MSTGYLFESLKRTFSEFDLSLMEAEIMKDNSNKVFVTNFRYTKDGTIYDKDIKITFKEIHQKSILLCQDNGTVYVNLIQQKLKEDLNNERNF